MSDYTKATDFTAKDALATGNASKLIKGSEIDAELDAIATAISSKADAGGATFSGITMSGTWTLSGTLSGSGTIDGGTY